jgi:hypothetical protein
LKINKTMTELLEKDKKFKWMPPCEASFQEEKLPGFLEDE